MKLLKLLGAILGPVLSIMILEPTVFGQCANNQTAQYITHDTSVLGTGNNEFVFTFPQFDPTLGTLLSVRLETTVTLMYSFQLENNNATSAEQKVRITRTDEISYPFDQVDKTDNRNLGPYHLASSDGVPGSGPDYVEDGPLYAFQNLHNTYNITTNVVPFLGIGTLDINYNTFSFANAVGNLNSNLSGQAQDFINFKISYYYCPTVFLAVDIMQFSATKLSSGNIELSWITPNDYSGKKYDVEKSADGRSFSTIQSLISGPLPSAGKKLLYKPTSNDKNRMYFRVRQFEADGSSRYSAIRDVIVSHEESKMKVYPTLAKNEINIIAAPNTKGDYRVTLLSTTGQVLQQNEFARSELMKVTFNHKMTPGFYIVSVCNLKTMVSEQAKIIIE